MIDSSKYVTLSEARQSLPDGYVIAEIPGSDGCLFGVFEKQHIIFKDDDGVWKETDCALEVPQVLSQIVCEIDPDGNSSKKHHVVFSVKKIQELRRRDVRTTYIYSIMCKRPPEQFSEGGTGII